MSTVRGAHITSSRHQESDGHDGCCCDAGHGGQMGFGTEGTAKEHRENRSHQGQERHEHQQRRRGEFLHGGCGRRMDDGWNRVTENRGWASGSDVFALQRFVLVGGRQNARGRERGESQRHGVDRGEFVIDRAADVGLAERLPCRGIEPTGP